MGQVDRDAAAPGWSIANLHAATVRRDVLAHNRKAKAGARTILHADAATESFEHRLTIGDRDTTPRVVDGDQFWAHSHRHRRGPVQERILHKIAKRTLKANRIANEGRGLSVELDDGLGPPRARTRHDIRGQIIQPKRLGLLNGTGAPRKVDDARDQLRDLINLAVKRDGELLAILNREGALRIAERLHVSSKCG